MMNEFFPQELIQQCLSTATNSTSENKEGDNTSNDNDPGATLQLLLSVLADLHSHSDNHESKKAETEGDLEAMRVFLLRMEKEQQTSKQDVTDSTVNLAASRPEDNLPDLWWGVILDKQQSTSAIVDSIQEQLRFLQQQQQQLAKNSFPSIWYLGLQLIALLLRHSEMTPFEVHSVAVQSVVFDLKNSAASSDTSNHIFWTLCILLCTWSLQQCQAEIKQQTADNTKKIRWKRIKSILLETLQLYQRHALAVTQEEDASDAWSSDEEEQEGVNHQQRISSSPPPCALTVPLWSNRVLPNCHSLWNCFPDTVVPSSSQFFKAVTISICSHLAVAVLEQQEERIMIVRLDRLWKAIQGLDLTLDKIWCHPWRVASFQPPATRNQQQHDSLDWWALQRGLDVITDDEHDDDADSASIPSSDDYENVDTSWSELGVALLAWKGWHDAAARQKEYQVDYEWRLFFPHINILLNPDQHPSTDMALQLTSIGIAWLQELLQILPTQTLLLPTSFSLGEPSASLPSHAIQAAMGANVESALLPPDHPSGTLQLLLNAIMSTASSPSSLQSSTALPSAVELFALCKMLLSKYEASCQLDIVFHQLLPTCPHPGLRPKILDLLRPLLVLFSEDSNNPNGDRLWCSLEDILRELGKYCDFQGHGGGKDLQLQSLEDLIDQTEYFVSACTMIQLGWNIMVDNNSTGSNPKEKRGHPRSLLLNCTHSTSDNTSVTLENFCSALHNQLEQWNSDTAAVDAGRAPDQFFRLFLLHNLLQQLVNL